MLIVSKKVTNRLKLYEDVKLFLYIICIHLAGVKQTTRTGWVSWKYTIQFQ